MERLVTNVSTKCRSVFSVLCVAFVAFIICVGLENTAVANEAKQALEFSDITVKTSSHTGFFVGRYASFEVSGWLTNSTGKPVNADNLPSLMWEDNEAKAKMSQEKLLADETCKVSFKGDLYLEDGKFPTVAFAGPVTFSGLEAAESQLNEEFQSIAKEFADKDKAVQEEAEKQEQEIAAEKAALLELKGKTAIEALEFAKTTTYDPYFNDAYGVGVTEDVRSAGKDDEIAKALVTEVEPSDALWIFGATVTFKLDYTDPTAAKERSDKAEAKAKVEADKAALQDCKGKTALEALEVAKGTDYEPHFRDSYDVLVTSDVQGAAPDSEIAKALVTDVRTSDAVWFFGASVTFNLEYTDPVAAKEREEVAAAEKAAQEEEAKRESIAELVKTLSGLPLVDVLDELDSKGLSYTITVHPAGTDVTDTLTRDDLKSRGLVVMEAQKSGYVSPYSKSAEKAADIKLKAVDPKYWENEKALEEVLPEYNAEKAVEKYANADGAKSTETWYAEALDANTWYLKGDVTIGKTRYTFEAKVAGTKSNPIVLEFNYY